MTAAISLQLESMTVRQGVMMSFVVMIDERELSEQTKGLMQSNASLIALDHDSGTVMNQSGWGAMSFMKPSCSIHRMAKS